DIIKTPIRRLKTKAQYQSLGDPRNNAVLGNHLRRKSVATIKRITGKSGHAARSHILVDARLTLRCHRLSVSQRRRHGAFVSAGC
ncbi:hypothetical protein, partial [Rhizobium leguminosarum]|uniref:hypothetical protein n=1 Tax=Rhizobium leguminosarum TaxID=384 RepID=UPI00197D1249